MNYLAHMVLGKAFGLTDQGVVGNFMGDAVKGRFVERHWSPEVAQGIRFHRALDGASDGHEASQEARALIRPFCGKWSGVVWDVLADHVLASQFGWLAQRCGTLDAFAARQLVVIGEGQPFMPERSVRFFNAMVRHQWLTGYAHKHVVEDVLKAMSRRRAMAGPVAEGIKAYEQHQGRLEECGAALMEAMDIWAQSEMLAESLSLTIERGIKAP